MIGGCVESAPPPRGPVLRSSLRQPFAGTGCAPRSRTGCRLDNSFPLLGAPCTGGTMWTNNRRSGTTTTHPIRIDSTKMSRRPRALSRRSHTPMRWCASSVVVPSAPTISSAPTVGPSWSLASPGRTLQDKWHAETGCAARHENRRQNGAIPARRGQRRRGVGRIRP